MAKHGRSAGNTGSALPPPSPPGTAGLLNATYRRALHDVPLLPLITSALDAPDTTAMAQRLAADIASLPARSRPRRAGAKSRAL